MMKFIKVKDNSTQIPWYKSVLTKTSRSFICLRHLTLFISHWDVTTGLFLDFPCNNLMKMVVPPGKAVIPTGKGRGR